MGPPRSCSRSWSWITACPLRSEALMRPSGRHPGAVARRRTARQVCRPRTAQGGYGGDKLGVQDRQAALLDQVDRKPGQEEVGLRRELGGDEDRRRRAASMLALVGAGLGVAVVPLAAEHWRPPGVRLLALAGAETVNADLLLAWTKSTSNPACRAVLNLVAGMTPAPPLPWPGTPASLPLPKPAPRPSVPLASNHSAAVKLRARQRRLARKPRRTRGGAASLPRRRRRRRGGDVASPAPRPGRHPP